MTKKYSEEFKKQMVQEYLKGTSYPKLSKEYHVAKSTLVGWVKKYSEECQFTKPQTSPSFSENAKEIHELQKRIHELEKENLFLKKAAAFFAKEIDSRLIDLLMKIRISLGCAGYSSVSIFIPMLIITTGKTEKNPFCNIGNRFLNRLKLFIIIITKF